jgi:crossover junction endodeoxyribonuclease RusA
VIRLAKLNDRLERDAPKKPNQVIVLKLPLPVSVNSMYLMNRKRGLTKKAKQWFSTAQYIARCECEKQGFEMDSGNVWYIANIDFYFGDMIKKDSHNYLKLMLDALENIVYKNDYFVKPRINIVELDRKRPRVEIRIKAEVVECQNG